MKPYYITEYPDVLNTKVIAVPIFENNYVYVLTDKTQRCLIVDPGLPEPVCEIVKKLQLQPTHLLITHSHPDHIGGVDRVRDIYPEIQKIADSVLAKAVQDEKAKAGFAIVGRFVALCRCGTACEQNHGHR